MQQPKRPSAMHSVARPMEDATSRSRRYGGAVVGSNTLRNEEYEEIEDQPLRNTMSSASKLVKRQ